MLTARQSRRSSNAFSSRLKPNAEPKAGRPVAGQGWLQAIAKGGGEAALEGPLGGWPFPGEIMATRLQALAGQ